MEISQGLSHLQTAINASQVYMPTRQDRHIAQHVMLDLIAQGLTPVLCALLPNLIHHQHLNFAPTAVLDIMPQK